MRKPYGEPPENLKESEVNTQERPESLQIRYLVGLYRVEAPEGSLLRFSESLSQAAGEIDHCGVAGGSQKGYWPIGSKHQAAWSKAFDDVIDIGNEI